MVVTVNYAESILNSDEKSFIQDLGQTGHKHINLNTTTLSQTITNNLKNINDEKINI